MKLVVGCGEAGIACLVRQIVDPTTFEFDMVVYLVDHLLKLAGVDTVRAHTRLPCPASFLGRTSKLDIILTVLLYVYSTQTSRKCDDEAAK